MSISRMLTLILLALILFFSYSPSALALGDYNFAVLYETEPFKIENHKGIVNINCPVSRFHDRIIEVAGKPEVFINKSHRKMELVDYRLSARKINDYYVSVTGVIQVRFPINTEYYYKIIRINKVLY